jgi:hypothetical protein
VNAKNENVSKFGPTIFTNTKTKIGWHQSSLLNSRYYLKYFAEPSGAPYDLNITWTINNDLILQWKHPNESNGPIKYFNIILNDGETNKIEKNLPITNNTYYLNYNFKVNAKQNLIHTYSCKLIVSR